MNEYINSVIEQVKKRDGDKPEFLQTVTEVFGSLEKVVEAHPEYVEKDILGRMANPDRFISFRVT